MAGTNPHGANATQSDPREQTMWDLYVKGITEGRENAYQAAVDAGYEEATARQITVRSWFIERKEKLKRTEMLSKAERNIERILDLPIEEIGTLKVVADMSKTIATTLGKDKGYSTRQEVTGKDGKDLMTTLTEEQQEKLNSLL